MREFFFSMRYFRIGRLQIQYTQRAMHTSGTTKTFQISMDTYINTQKYILFTKRSTLRGDYARLQWE